MNTSEEKQMTKQDAELLLANAIKTLAKNAVQNKHLTNYIEQLEQFIAALDKEEKEKAEQAKLEEAANIDEPKTE